MRLQAVQQNQAPQSLTHPGLGKDSIAREVSKTFMLGVPSLWYRSIS